MTKTAKAKVRAGWGALTEVQRAEVARRVQAGADIADLAGEYDVPVRTLDRRLREYVAARRPAASAPLGDFERHWALYCKLIGRDPDRPLPRPGLTAERTPAHRRVIVVCDLHGNPYLPLIHKVIDAAPDLVVLDGDIFDAFAMSEHPKDRPGPISEEMARVRALLETLAEKGFAVMMTSGNHDDRAKKYFQRYITPEFLPLVQWNLLELAAQGLPNVAVVDNHYTFFNHLGNAVPGELRNNFVAHVGDALIGHSEIARKGELRSVDAFAEWWEKWRLPLNKPTPRLVIQAHVHRAGVSYPAGGHQVRVEGGYAGQIAPELQYVFDYGAAKWGPPVHGYTSFVQALVDGEWRTDLDTVKFNLC